MKTNDVPSWLALQQLIQCIYAAVKLGIPDLPRTAPATVRSSRRRQHHTTCAVSPPVSAHRRRDLDRGRCPAPLH